jgi:hypothetical protein
MDGKPGETSGTGGSAMVLPGTRLANALDSALIVAATTGLVVFWGYSYYASFYGAIGYEGLASTGSTSKYAMKSAVIIFGIIFLCLTFAGQYRPKGSPPVNMAQAFVANAFYLSLVVVLFLWQLTFASRGLGIVFLACTGGIILATLFGKAIWQLYENFMPWLQTMMWILISLGIGTLLFIAKGTDDAMKFLEGRLDSGSTIEIQMKDGNSILDGRTFGLVEQTDALYYLVELSKPASSDPRLYVVEIEEVELAVIQSMDGDINSADRNTEQTATPLVPLPIS